MINIWYRVSIEARLNNDYEYVSDVFLRLRISPIIAYKWFYRYSAVRLLWVLPALRWLQCGFFRTMNVLSRTHIENSLIPVNRP